LRTTFQRQPGLKVPFQVIHDALLPDWREIDLCGLVEQTQSSRTNDLLREDGERCFDFDHGPLFYASLLRLSENKHALLCTLPSLCADVVTLQNITREIAHLYTGETGGGYLPEEPLQYVDYAEWQNDTLENEPEEVEAGKAFWNEQAIDNLPPLTLPFERRIRKQVGAQPEWVSCTINSDVLSHIDMAANQCGVDVSTFLLAAWQGLLWRLTGQEEIVVGVMSKGRNYEEMRDSLGLFARLLPICVRMEDNPTFTHLLSQAGKAVAKAEEWQNFLPWNAGTDSEPYAEIAPVGFEFHPRLAPIYAGSTTFTLSWWFSRVEPFTACLACDWGEEEALLHLVFHPHLLSRDDAERTLDYFLRFLAAAANNLESPIRNHEILGDAERHRVLVEFNQTQAEYPANRCFHTLFEETAARYPDRPALIFEDTVFSYRELNTQANRIAHYLRRLGVQADVRVGLCLDRSAEMIVALLGIMKAGGAYVPLHPELPKARLAYQLEETGAPVLITQSSLLGRLPEYAGHTFCLDRDAEQIACGPDTNPEPVTTSENLAYVIYTSGSTGVPKGVAIRHRNLVNYTHFLCEKVRRYDPSAYESGLHFATVSTISADLGNTCIFPALVSGGCLHVISYEASMDSRLFAQHMTKHPIDVLKITPSNLVALLSAPEGQHILPRKLLITGGEASSWDLVERVKQMGTCKILNHYGPTETTIGSLTFPVTESSLDATESATVPIGKPIANTVVYILDGNLKPVPIGVPGEICIGGAGVAAGYLNQPQQTAERFIPNPYSPQISENLYRTGDLARFLHDGNIEFLGRIDHQLKIRGFRVEPAEIESVLRKHPGVQQGLVMAREDQPGDKRLVAYVVPALGVAPTSEALRHFLAAQLPDYMIPSAFVMLDSLPLTPNGKIDRRALPAPEQARLSGDREVVAARNPIEEKLIAIWSDVLGVEPIGVCDNFFELGGHSLLATQVIARVRSAFQIQVPLRSLFETPTIAGLAEVIAQLQSEAGIDEELDRMLAELEGLSEEEVEKLLAEETHNT